MSETLPDPSCVRSQPRLEQTLWHRWFLLIQNGLMRNPVPSGENGFTFAHIKASFREMADLPSSSTNTGPWTRTKEIFQKHTTVLEKQQQIVCSCLSSQVSATFFLLVVAQSSPTCCCEKPNKLLFCISAFYWD